MSILESNLSVTMIRCRLEDIPFYAVPAGYSIRSYLPGDEQIWVLLQSAADRYNRITLELFHQEFGDDPALLAQRQFFLVDGDGRVIGTATAWLDQNYHGRPFGRVHWVAISPDMQGLGLSKPLLSKVCSTLQALGHDKAYLVTSTARVAAISLYAHFGFVPEINTSEDAVVWTEMKQYVPGLDMNHKDQPNHTSDGISPDAPDLHGER